MSIFAIADLHLSLGTDKPMHIFGASWANHEARIRDAWTGMVRENDTVIIPGDISWGMTMEEALPDLVFLDALPGRKILSKGNHDYWWGTMGKVENFAADHGLSTLSFMKNNAYLVEGRAICGSRGWLLPSDPEFKSDDRTVYMREVARLERSLEAGRALFADGDGPLIAVLHYPPVLKTQHTSEFTELLEKYGAEICVYGHLHGRGHQKAFEGIKNGVEYCLAAGDYISFKPLRL
jgi:hypothetical protein